MAVKYTIAQESMRQLPEGDPLITRIRQQPQSSTESMTGKQEPNQLKKAKELLSKLSKFKVANNCQRFAAALELAFRGTSVEVVPTKSPVARVFDVPIGKAFPLANWFLIRNCKIDPISKDDPCASIEKTMKSYGNGARAIISVVWKSGSGHVFNLINIDGEIYLMDATANRFKKIQESAYLKEKIDAPKSIGIIRTDKGSIDKDMKEATFAQDERMYTCGIVESNGQIAWVKTRFISVHAALSLIGKKNAIVRVCHGEDTVGDVRCIEIDEEYGNDYTVWNYKWL